MFNAFNVYQKSLHAVSTRVYIFTLHIAFWQTGFTGIDDPYEPPVNSEVSLRIIPCLPTWAQPTIPYSNWKWITDSPYYWISGLLLSLCELLLFSTNKHILCMLMP